MKPPLAPKGLADAIFLEPRLKRLPVPDQRFVRHFHGGIGGRVDEAHQRIATRDAFIAYTPFLCRQIVVWKRFVALHRVDHGLVAAVGALVGLSAQDTTMHPVAKTGIK